jgi:hypothetical protein
LCIEQEHLIVKVETLAARRASTQHPERSRVYRRKPLTRAANSRPSASTNRRAVCTHRGPMGGQCHARSQPLSTSTWTGIFTSVGRALWDSPHLSQPHTAHIGIQAEWRSEPGWRASIPTRR